MKIPCGHDPKHPDKCHLCWLFANNDGFRRKWGGDTRPACANLGPANGKTVDCPTCNGRVALKLFDCSEFGECTVGKAVGGVACCVGCEKYA